MDAKDIGDRVRIARREMRLRQDELAGAAGVGVRFIVELEAGKPTVRMDKLIRVLGVLGLSLDVGAKQR